MTQWVKDKKGKFAGSIPSTPALPHTPKNPNPAHPPTPSPTSSPNIPEVHKSYQKLIDEYSSQDPESNAPRGFLTEKYDEALAWIKKYPTKTISEIHSIMTRDAWIKGRNETRELINTLTPQQIHAWLNEQPTITPNEATNDTAHIFSITPSELQKHLAIDPEPLTKEQKTVLTRVGSLWEDQGMKYTKVLHEAKNGGYIIASLQKNPTKQGIYEPTVAAYIQEKTDTPVLILASARNKISIRFNNDGDYDLSGKSKDGYTKDADLAIIIPHGNDGVKVFLASHKYGRSRGGHQDNQKKDAVAFLTGAEASLKNNPDIPELRDVISKSLGREIPKSKFSWEPALILDGDFFTGVDEWITAKTYDHSRDKRTTGKARFVGDADQFISFLTTLGVKK